MATATNSNKGFVFYKNSKGNWYYINTNREHIFIENPSLLNFNKDLIYKDIINKTAKEYTYRGYSKIRNGLFFNFDAVQTMWVTIKSFNNEYELHFTKY